MELTGKTCAIEPFSADQAVIQTHSNLGPILDAFHQELSKRLSKDGLLIGAASAGLGACDFTVEGQFVRIDEGNRAARYFLTFLAGAASVEVEGRLFHGEYPVMDLHAKGVQSIGIFGGSSERMLQTCAAAAAGQIAGQIAEALANR
jgi:hypothetical protein